MHVPTHAELIERIDQFLERHQMRESRLARDATGEPGLIGAIREGRSPTLATLEKLASFMRRIDEERDRASAELDRRTEAARGLGPDDPERAAA